MEEQNAAREEENDSDEVSMYGTLKLVIAFKTIYT